MTEEVEREETMLESYVRWMFQGNTLFVALKFIWTGMYLTAFLTFQFIEGAVILGIGFALWFIANDWQNWEIELEE